MRYIALIICFLFSALAAGCSTPPPVSVDYRLPSDGLESVVVFGLPSDLRAHISDDKLDSNGVYGDPNRIFGSGLAGKGVSRDGYAVIAIKKTRADSTHFGFHAFSGPYYLGTVFPCSGGTITTFQVAPGEVAYLGDFRFLQRAGNSLGMDVQYDFDAAQTFLRQKFPAINASAMKTVKTSSSKNANGHGNCKQ